MDICSVRTKAPCLQPDPLGERAGYMMTAKPIGPERLNLLSKVAEG